MDDRELAIACLQVAARGRYQGTTVEALISEAREYLRFVWRVEDGAAVKKRGEVVAAYFQKAREELDGLEETEKDRHTATYVRNSIERENAAARGHPPLPWPSIPPDVSDEFLRGVLADGTPLPERRKAARPSPWASDGGAEAVEKANAEAKARLNEQLAWDTARGVPVVERRRGERRVFPGTVPQDRQFIPGIGCGPEFPEVRFPSRRVRQRRNYRVVGCGPDGVDRRNRERRGFDGINGRRGSIDRRLRNRP